MNNIYKKNKYGLELFLIGVAIVPSITFAAAKNFAQFIDMILAWIDIAIPITMALAVLFFFKNILISVVQKDSTEQMAKLKTNAMWGIAIIFLMVSIWGVVALLRNTFLTGDSEFGGGGGSSSLPSETSFDLSR